MLDRLGDQPQRPAAFVQVHRPAQAHAHGVWRIAVGAESGAGHHADALQAEVGRKPHRAPGRRDGQPEMKPFRLRRYAVAAQVLERKLVAGA